MRASEAIVRPFIAIFFGVAIALLLSVLVGLLFPAVQVPVFIILSLIWIGACIQVLLRQAKSYTTSLDALRTGKSWKSEALPPEFRFINNETTLKEVIDKIGAYSRIRGTNEVRAVQYDLPYGAAVLVFVDPPLENHSKILGVQFFTNNTDIPLFP